MILLLIDTSGENALVVLARDGHVVAERQWQNDRTVGQKVLQVIDKLLREQNIALAEIQRVAVHSGPGYHYSALRAGVVAATMLAEATGADLVAVRGQDASAMVHEALEMPPVDLVKPEYGR